MRNYTRQEIASVTGVDTSNRHFARKVQDTLTNWGYSYEYSRKGVKITRVPTTPEEKLSEIVIRYYKLDVQTDTYGFAAFMLALNSDDDGFLAAPWEERASFLKDIYGVEVSIPTLRKWTNRLLDSGYIKKDLIDKGYWKTNNLGQGYKSREQVEQNDKGKKEYWNKFWALKNSGVKNPISILWDDENPNGMGCVYYSCKRLMPGKWDSNGLEIIQEIDELCDQIADKHIEEIKKAQEKIEKQIKLKKEAEEARKRAKETADKKREEIKKAKEQGLIEIEIPEQILKENPENFELIEGDKYRIKATGKIGHIKR